jgi:hypothetical protein
MGGIGRKQMATENGVAIEQRPADETSKLELAKTKLALAQIPKSAPVEAWELTVRRATALSNSLLVPKEYQGNVSNCLVALQYADRIGADPMMVIQNMDVIHGRPSLRATFLIGTVNACGRFSPLRFRFTGTPGSDDWGCRAIAKDKDDGEDCVGSLITIVMSKEEGWATKPGSKWKSMPEQMLRYRAAAFWTRIYAPDLLLGMRTADEAADIGPHVIPTENLKALEASLLGDVPVAEVVDPNTGEITRGAEVKQ